MINNIELGKSPRPLHSEIDAFFDGEVCTNPKVSAIVSKELDEMEWRESMYRMQARKMAGNGRNGKFVSVSQVNIIGAFQSVLTSFYENGSWDLRHRPADGTGPWHATDMGSVIRQKLGELPDGSIMISPSPKGEPTVRLYRGCRKFDPDNPHTANYARDYIPSYQKRQLENIRKFMAGEMGFWEYLREGRHTRNLEQDVREALWIVPEDINTPLAVLAWMHYRMEIGRVGTSPFVATTADPVVAKEFASEFRVTNIGSKSMQGILVMEVPQSQAVRLRDIPQLEDKRNIRETEYGVIAEVKPEYIIGFIPMSRRVPDDKLQNLVGQFDRRYQDLAA